MAGDPVYVYRVVWKRYSEIQKAFALVETDIEAVRFDIKKDGTLVFYNPEYRPFMACPAGSWAGVELATEPRSALTTN